MGAIISFFEAIGDFFTMFADGIVDGMSMITDIVSNYIFIGGPVLAILAIYTIFSLIGRS